MLRVAEQYAATDTGRQRRANEDALLARAPLFVVADGMGGAQAGEVASRIAVESLQQGLSDAAEPESALAALVQAANGRIHELSHTNAAQAGMGTTLTAVYVGEQDVTIAHVGDSRAYCLRDGELQRLTDDHSLVDELIRQGRLTAQEAVEHPQRSVITRALGPEGSVEVDTRSYRGRAGDLYLLCSDGLTTMVSEEQLAAALKAHRRLRDAGEALIAMANEAGGRDNITVVLLRLEEVQMGAAPGAARSGAGEQATIGAAGDAAQTSTGAMAAVTGAREAGSRDAGAAAAATEPRRPRPSTRLPRHPSAARSTAPAPAGPRRRRARHLGALAITLVVLALLASGAYLAWQSVYFIGTNNRGLVTLFRGVPYELPGHLALYSSDFVSGVSASTLSAQRRRTLLDHSLRSEGDATALMRSLELGQLE